MHLPDGWLVGHEEVLGWVVAVAAIVVIAVRASRVPARVAPARLAAVAALVFALQMINVPIADGTSGHVIGAALAVTLVGTELGILAVSGVLVVQCLLFADGGIAALGLNVINMAIVPGLVCAFLLARRAPVLVASFASVLAASSAFSLEYALGGVGDARVELVAASMLGIHLVIAAGESVLTTAIVWADRRFHVRPAVVVAGAMLLAACVAPWASSAPDGLERVAIDRGFASFEQPHPLLSVPLADYEADGVSDARAATGLAGMLGVIVTAGIAGGSALLLARRRSSLARP